MNLLELKKAMNAKRPKFVREDSQRKEVKKKWRAPRGQQNKVRKQVHGHIAIVKKGYRSPKQVRGLTLKGLKPLLVSNEKDIAKATKENCIILTNIGAKKKIELLKKAIEKKIPVLNEKNPQEKILQLQKKFEERVNTKKIIKKNIKSEQKTKPEEKQKMSEDERKEKEKKELDKLLTSETK